MALFKLLHIEVLINKNMITILSIFNFRFLLNKPTWEDHIIPVCNKGAIELLKLGSLAGRGKEILTLIHNISEYSDSIPEC